MELEKLARDYPKFVQNLRGKEYGGFIAFDTQEPAAVVSQMKSLGVNIGTCGTRTIRLRPMLIFGEEHSKFACQAVKPTLRLFTN